MKNTLIVLGSLLLAAPAMAANPCLKGQLVTLRFGMINQSAQYVPAGTKAQLLGFKSGYVDALVLQAAPKSGTEPTQCELVQKSWVLVGGNEMSFLECELQPL